MGGTVRFLASFALAISLGAGGCASPRPISLTAGPGQEKVLRDGHQALISRKTHFVMLRPNARTALPGARPAFTVVVRNSGPNREDLLEQNIAAFRTERGKQVALKVMRYEELVSEENTRRNVQAIAVALSGAANQMAASNAGYSTATVNTYSSYGGYRGTSTVQIYDPGRAYAAQSLARAQTAADMAAVTAEGERTMAQLEANVLKDNTVMPGEWYGGTVVLGSLPYSTELQDYSVLVTFGGEQHEFSIRHGGANR